MRYQNWDVLLFPEVSKTPIQEFKTQCHVIRDLDSPILHDPSLANVHYALDGNPPMLLPVLTSFVPSLQQNQLFRVSIHSWERPKPSGLIESLGRASDAILFQARVYIDGILVAYDFGNNNTSQAALTQNSSSIIDQHTSWPHVIDTSSSLTKSGKEDGLQFPQFHQEILYQSHWEAGEVFGRIRVVIAEGIVHDAESPHFRWTSPFQRVKDVIAFSFQHAPQHVLEFSNIAWPNAGMWKKGAPCFPPMSRPNPTKTQSGEEVHAHSPRQPSIWADANTSAPAATQSKKVAPVQFRPASTMAPPMELLNQSRWVRKVIDQDALVDAIGHDDPFTDFQIVNAGCRQNKRSTIQDTTMPDYESTSGTDRTRAYTNMSGVSYENGYNASTSDQGVDEAIANLVKQMSPEKKDELLVQALSPDKPNRFGTQPPTNTPTNDTCQSITTGPVRAGLKTQHEDDIAISRVNAEHHLEDDLTEPSLPDKGLRKGNDNTDPIKSSPAHSIRVKKRMINYEEDKENHEIQRRAASLEVTRTSSTTFKMSAFALDKHFFSEGELNRPSSGSSGSKRKRLTPETVESAEVGRHAQVGPDGEDDHGDDGYMREGSLIE